MSNLVRLLSFLKLKIGEAWTWVQQWVEAALRSLSAPRYDLIWEGLAFIGLLPLLYYVLRLWYHGLGYDPDFLSFTTEVATLLALVSLLGGHLRMGKATGYAGGSDRQFFALIAES